MKHITFFLIAFILASCSQQPTYSVEELTNNKELFKEIKKACRNGDRSSQSETCLNLEKATKSRLWS